MTRRTRRNLSDRRIKRIVKRNLEGKESSPTEFTPKTSSNFGRIALWTTLAILVLAIYFGVSQIPWDYLFGSQESLTTQPSREKPQAEQTAPREPARQSPQESSPAGEDTRAEKKPEESRPVVHPVPQKTQVEILNGCGVSGIAKKATRFCRQNDLDVVAMGNFKNFDVQNSYVIDWMGNKEKARWIARLMGIDPKRVITKIDPTKQLDATIVLGKDYRKLKPFKQ